MRGGYVRLSDGAAGLEKGGWPSEGRRHPAGRPSPGSEAREAVHPDLHRAYVPHLDEALALGMYEATPVLEAT